MITAFAPALQTAPGKPALYGDPATIRTWYYLAALVALVVTALAGLVRFAELRWPFGTEAPAQHDMTPPFAQVEQKARHGDPEAQLQLGILYARGDGVELDYDAAAKWFKAAADQGLARAQFDMGVLYERGRGVQIDHTRAASWYLKAAEAGYPLAEYNLAVFYTSGEGLARNLAEAALWYRRAALHGVPQAMANLAEMYDKSLGVQSSPADAYAWYLAAAVRGNQAARQRAEEIVGILSPANRSRAKLLANDISASIKPNPEIADQFGLNAGGSGL